MAIIGTFSLKDGKYTGTIRTMTINVKSVLIPNEKNGNDKAPDYKLVAGGAQLGAAWKATGKGENGKDYLSVELDDPSFAGPIRAAFFEDQEAEQGTLVWSRA